MAAYYKERAAAKAEDTAKSENTYMSRRAKVSRSSTDYGDANGLSFSSIMNQYPVLSPKEGKELINKKNTEEWPEAKEELLLSNLRLVTSIARRYAWIDGCSFDDVVSHGVIGLMKALDRFNPEEDVRLSTYGTQWIQQEIRDGLLYKKGQIRNPAYMEKLVARLKRCRAELAQEGVSNPSMELLSERTGIPMKNIHKVIAVCNMDMVSMEASVSSDNDDLVVGDALTSGESIEDEAVNNVTLLDVAEAIRKLEPLEQKIIMMRFGFIDGKPMTFEQCAKETGYSAESCRRFSEAAIKKLQADYLGKRIR